MTVLENFREMDFAFLIPLHLEKTSSGEYVTREYLKDAKNGYVQCYFDEESLENLDTEEYVEKTEDYDEEFSSSRLQEFSSVRPETLEDLKYMFDLTDMEDEEFLQMGVGELFGITNNQLKFVKRDALLRAGVPKFLESFQKNEKKIPDIERRIKYALIDAVVRFEMIASSIFRANRYVNEYEKENLNAEIKKYFEKIVFTHTIDEVVEIMPIYRDYISFLEEAMEMDSRRLANGEKVVGYELFPKVSKIRDLHSKAYRDKLAIDSEKAVRLEASQNEKIEEIVSTSEYKRMLYKGEKYSVVGVTCVKDILNEGKKLSHCIGTYVSKFVKGDDFIYFVRETSSLETPLYSMEVVVNKYTGRYELEQCYGYGDTTKKSAELRHFICNWATRNNIKINCIV